MMLNFFYGFEKPRGDWGQFKVTQGSFLTQRVATLNDVNVVGSLFMILVDFDHLQKTKSLASCSRCGYKVETNISYARETEKAKIKCPVLCG